MTVKNIPFVLNLIYKSNDNINNKKRTTCVDITLLVFYS